MLLGGAVGFAVVLGRIAAVVQFFTGVRTAAVFTHRVFMYLIARHIILGHRRARGAPRARVDLTIVHVVRRHVLTGIRRQELAWPLLDWAPVSAARAAPLARPKVAVSKRVVSFFIFIGYSC